MKEIEIHGEKVNGGFKMLDGYDNLYCVNEYGEVVSPSYVDKCGHLRKARILKPQIRGKGYLCVGLMKNGKQVHKSVHRLVATLFVDNPDNKEQVNHKDGNKLNNHYSNLEWCTNQENIKHAYDNGLKAGTKHVGELNTMSKLTEDNILDILHSNKSVAELADKYNVSKSCIYKIRQGKTWTYLRNDIQEAA